MPSKSRGGLSKREYAAKNSILKPAKSPVMSAESAKKASASSVSKTPSFKKETKMLAEAQKEYMAALTPSKEETDITNKQQGILMNQEKQAQNIKNEAIASTFQDRQIDRLSQDTSEAVIPLKYQIAALQSQRESRAELARAKSSMAEKAYNLKAKQYTSKTSNPLDDEYKKLRNAQLEYSLNNPKKAKGKTSKYNLEEDIDQTISSGKTWEETAQYLKGKGQAINRGSKADILLNKRFNPKKSGRDR